MFKKVVRAEAKTYKPISVLKKIHNQIQDYPQKNELLYIYQLDFRASYSTDTCMSWLTSITLDHAKNGKYTVMILIDLQKVFDSFDHKLLLDKMNGIDKTIIWFHYYLTNGTSSVSLDNVFLEAGTINCSVPLHILII